MIGSTGFELAPRGAWLRQWGGEALPGRTVSLDSGARPQASAVVLCMDQVSVASSTPIQTVLPPGTRHLFVYSPGLVQHSIPIVRPVVQRFSPIHF